MTGYCWGYPGRSPVILQVKPDLIEEDCLTIKWCAPHHSQHWCISLKVSCMEALPAKTTRCWHDKAVNRVVIAGLLCLLTESCCLVIYCYTTVVIYICLTKVSNTARLVRIAFFIHLKLRYPSISFPVLLLLAVTFFPVPLKIV